MVEAITSRPPPQLKPRLVIRSSKSKMSSGFGRKVPCIFCERVVLQSHMTKHISLCHDKALQLYCLSCEKKCFGEPNFSLEGKIKVMTYKCHICKKNSRKPYLGWITWNNPNWKTTSCLKSNSFCQGEKRYWFLDHTIKVSNMGCLRCQDHMFFEVLWSLCML